MASHEIYASQSGLMNSAKSQSVPSFEKRRKYMLTLPSEWSHMFTVAKDGIASTGSAAIGKIGPALGKRDIAESDDSYLFRVALPGVARDSFSCDVDPTGHILIKGVTVTGEKTVYRHSMKLCNLRISARTCQNLLICKI